MVDRLPTSRSVLSTSPVEEKRHRSCGKLYDMYGRMYARLVPQLHTVQFSTLTSGSNVRDGLRVILASTVSFRQSTRLYGVAQVQAGLIAPVCLGWAAQLGSTAPEASSTFSFPPATVSLHTFPSHHRELQGGMSQTCSITGAPPFSLPWFSRQRCLKRQVLSLHSV